MDSTEDSAPRDRGWSRSLRRVVRLAFALYVLAVLILIILIYGPGERFWPTTLFLFGPNWLALGPLAILVPAAALRDRRLLLPLAGIGLLVVGPVLGFCVPWRRLWPGGDGPVLRCLTWNVDGNRLDAKGLAGLLEKERPDVAVLQECEAQHLSVPGGWYTRRDNGICLLSRFPIRDVAVRDPSDVWAMSGSGEIVRYALSTPTGDVHVTNVHLETPREGLEEILHGSRSEGVQQLVAKNRQRALEASLARSWADQATGPARIVAGDFNTPPQSNLMRQFWSDYANCFGVAGFGFGYSKHTRRIGVRIDHVLAGPGWRCQAAWVMHWPGSDHDPVIADLRWTAGEKP